MSGINMDNGIRGAARNHPHRLGAAVHFGWPGDSVIIPLCFGVQALGPFVFTAELLHFPEGILCFKDMGQVQGTGKPKHNREQNQLPG